MMFISYNVGLYFGKDQPLHMHIEFESLDNGVVPKILTAVDDPVIAATIEAAATKAVTTPTPPLPQWYLDQKHT